MIEQVTYPYQPDFAPPPGDTILELLEEQGMTQSELAQRMGRPLKTINEVVRGKKTLTPETALQLEKVLGTPARLWLKLEQNYREHLARQAENEVLQEQLGWLDHFPIKEMLKRSWLPPAPNKSHLMADVLQFFGIASPDSWKDIWSGSLVSYRKTAAYESSDYALSVWLRQGELEAQDIDCTPYDQAVFKKLLLNEIRSLTREMPDTFGPKLVELCASVGVAVVFVPQVAKARVSGATRWLSKEKALIQLSLRYKTNDHFWFTFFHEAGHIVKHGKRDVFIDVEDGEHDAKEQEADQFAAETLIPANQYARFVRKNKRVSGKTVKQFAKETGIAPGIIVGRLQYDERLPYTHLNGLKVKFEWAEQNTQEPANGQSNQ